MKTILLALVLSATVLAQTPVNPLDTCLSAVYINVDQLMKSTKLGLDGNIIDALKGILDTSADCITSYQECKKVATMDAAGWVDEHGTKGQKDCLSKGISAYIFIKKTNQDISKKSDRDIIIKDFSAMVASLDAMWQTCFGPAPSLMEGFLDN